MASSDAAGQSLVETTIALTIVLLFVFALIHLSMLAVTRHLANYAAFSASRASVYGGSGDRDRAQEAARAALRVLPRGTEFVRLDMTGRTLRVQALSPFSYPLFGTGAGGKVVVAAQAPLYVQPRIAEAGDNASR